MRFNPFQLWYTLNKTKYSLKYLFSFKSQNIIKCFRVQRWISDIFRLESFLYVVDYFKDYYDGNLPRIAKSRVHHLLWIIYFGILKFLYNLSYNCKQQHWKLFSHKTYITSISTKLETLENRKKDSIEKQIITIEEKRMVNYTQIIFGFSSHNLDLELFV